MASDDETGASTGVCDAEEGSASFEMTSASVEVTSEVVSEVLETSFGGGGGELIRFFKIVFDG